MREMLRIPLDLPGLLTMAVGPAIVEGDLIVLDLDDAAVEGTGVWKNRGEISCPADSDQRDTAAKRLT